MLRLARALSVSELFDAVAAHGVVYAAPGQARPFDLGVLIGLEWAVPLFAAAGGGFLEFRVGVGPADHPVPEIGIARFLFDAIARAGIVDRAPSLALPLRFCLVIALERAELPFGAAVLHAIEFGVG